MTRVRLGHRIWLDDLTWLRIDFRFRPEVLPRISHQFVTPFNPAEHSSVLTVAVSRVEEKYRTSPIETQLTTFYQVLKYSNKDRANTKRKKSKFDSDSRVRTQSVRAPSSGRIVTKRK